MEQPSAPTPSRRTVMLAGAGTAAGLAALTACGSSSSPTAGAQPSATAQPSSAGGAGAALVKLSDVPVGGAVSAKDAQGRSVIVSQPKAGEVVAFSAICTHMGCTVAPAKGILQCPCHGSTYDLATGKNTGGPAPRPLSAISVSVKEGSVVES
ncbi:MAG: Rieske (2Fe-2S) protein [Angustibacter sp.]